MQETYLSERDRILNECGAAGKRVYIQDSYLLRAAEENGKHIYYDRRKKQSFFLEFSDWDDAALDKLVQLKMLEYAAKSSRGMRRFFRTMTVLVIVLIGVLLALACAVLIFLFG